jgi:hypothetical protein
MMTKYEILKKLDGVQANLRHIERNCQNSEVERDVHAFIGMVRIWAEKIKKSDKIMGSPLEESDADTCTNPCL